MNDLKKTKVCAVCSSISTACTGIILGLAIVLGSAVTIVLSLTALAFNTIASAKYWRRLGEQKDVSEFKNRAQ